LSLIIPPSSLILYYPPLAFHPLGKLNSNYFRLFPSGGGKQKKKDVGSKTQAGRLKTGIKMKTNLSLALKYQTATKVASSN